MLYTCKYTYIHIYTPASRQTKYPTPPPHPMPPPQHGVGGGVGWGGGVFGLPGVYICIYVYLCISGFPLSAPAQTYFQFWVFGIPTFSSCPFTFSIWGFLDSHFQRLAFYIFNFGFFMIFGVLNHGKSWEIVGNRGKLSPKTGESWEIVGRSWEIVEIVPNP